MVLSTIFYDQQILVLSKIFANAQKENVQHMCIRHKLFDS
jgi:hypothetical protein